MLFYKIFGSSSLENKTPLVFLHGFLGSHLDFLPMIEELQNSYCCIAIDLPSHGKSPDSENIFSSVEKTLLSLNTPAPILIGYSLGGRLALAYGQKHPDKIKALIAISAHTGLKTSLEKENRTLQDLMWQERLKTLSSQEFLTLWYEQPVFSSLRKNPELLQKLLKVREYTSPEKLASILEQASLAKQPLYDKFPHPIYFLFGEEDVAYEKLYATHPSYLKKKIENAGHAAHLENPKACIEAILTFNSFS